MRISLEWIKEKLENEYYTGQESQKKKKQKEMLKRKLDMKKIKIDILFRLTL